MPVAIEPELRHVEAAARLAREGVVIGGRGPWTKVGGPRFRWQRGLLRRGFPQFNNPNAGTPNGPSEVELAVDVYFLGTVASLPAELRGRGAHAGGCNSLLLDGSAGFVRDRRISGN